MYTSIHTYYYNVIFYHIAISSDGRGHAPLRGQAAGARPGRAPDEGVRDGPGSAVRLLLLSLLLLLYPPLLLLLLLFIITIIIITIIIIIRQQSLSQRRLLLSSLLLLLSLLL